MFQARSTSERRIALEDFVSTALVDQMAARDYLARRCTRSSEEAFRKALDMIPEVEPDDYDRINRT